MKKKFKKNKKLLSKNSDKLSLLVIIIIISLVLFFNYMNKILYPVISNYAYQEITKITSQIINYSINKEVTDNINIEDLFILNKDNSDNINTVDFNPVTVNQLLTSVTTNVYENLLLLENGGLDWYNFESEININLEEEKNDIIFYVPLFLATNNILLNNIGPKVPVKLELVGSVVSNVVTNITNYGINNALVEVFVEITVTQQVILPFLSEKIEITSKIPLSIKLINGQVPEYYFNGLGESSPIVTLPT